MELVEGKYFDGGAAGAFHFSPYIEKFSIEQIVKAFSLPWY